MNVLLFLIVMMTTLSVCTGNGLPSVCNLDEEKKGVLIRNRGCNGHWFCNLENECVEWNTNQSTHTNPTPSNSLIHNLMQTSGTFFSIKYGGFTGFILYNIFSSNRSYKIKNHTSISMIEL